MCPICLESLDENFLEISPCGHRYCRSCVTLYLKSILNSGSSNYFPKCPAPECNSFIEDLSVLNPSDRARLLRLQEVAKAKSSLTLSHCYCVTSDCGKKIYYPKNATRIVCDDCSGEMCGICLANHPSWVPCLAHEVHYLGTHPREALSKTTAFLSSRCCPKCGEFISKKGGCNHVRCKCGFTFCWYCKLQVGTHKKGICPAVLGICIATLPVTVAVVAGISAICAIQCLSEIRPRSSPVRYEEEYMVLNDD